jgi:hypothetical protein
VLWKKSVGNCFQESRCLAISEEYKPALLDNCRLSVFSLLMQFVLRSAVRGFILKSGPHKVGSEDGLRGRN